jgi:hypothetical protein
MYRRYPPDLVLGSIRRLHSFLAAVADNGKRVVG